MIYMLLVKPLFMLQAYIKIITIVKETKFILNKNGIEKHLLKWKMKIIIHNNI